MKEAKKGDKMDENKKPQTNLAKVSKNKTPAKTATANKAQAKKEGDEAREKPVKTEPKEPETQKVTKKADEEEEVVKDESSEKPVKTEPKEPETKKVTKKAGEEEEVVKDEYSEKPVEEEQIEVEVEMEVEEKKGTGVTYTYLKRLEMICEA